MEEFELMELVMELRRYELQAAIQRTSLRNGALQQAQEYRAEIDRRLINAGYRDIWVLRRKAQAEGIYNQTNKIKL